MVDRVSEKRYKKTQCPLIGWTRGAIAVDLARLRTELNKTLLTSCVGAAGGRC